MEQQNGDDLIPNCHKKAQRGLIPMSVQNETNSLVLWISGVVARSLQIAADMRLARALPETQNPARLRFILNPHWNKAKAPFRTFHYPAKSPQVVQIFLPRIARIARIFFEV